MTRRTLVAFAVLAAVATGVSAQAPDRSKPPATGPAPALKLPAIQKRALSNGLPVWIVELHKVPVAQINLVVLGGSADDPAGKYGVASLTAAMLEEGAGSRSSLEIADAIDFLGADLSAASGSGSTRDDKPPVRAASSHAIRINMGTSHGAACTPARRKNGTAFIGPPVQLCEAPGK